MALVLLKGPGVRGRSGEGGGRRGEVGQRDGGESENEDYRST